MVSNIYTKTGDKGDTSLIGGARVSKSDIRVEAYGTVDELNSAIGAALPLFKDAKLSEDIRFLMHKVFVCAANLACPAFMESKKLHIEEQDIAYLEKAIDRMDEAVGPIRGFVLPTGTQAASMLHLARTICRRAERRLVFLAESEPVDAPVIAFINRTSDFLFAAARLCNHLENTQDIVWDKHAAPPKDPK
jgi:cob(I)alamin adenosyltransferase